MSILNYFDSQQKKQNRDYFIQLLNIARADGVITETENNLLHRIGNRLGFTSEEIDILINNPGPSNYHPPVELAQRFEQLYDIVKMTLADGQITDDEEKVALHFAVASGFNQSDSPLLMDILVAGIQEGKDEEELLAEYKKKRVK
jgi:uncharacterized tellurite resistance protein B-like protein